MASGIAWARLSVSAFHYAQFQYLQEMGLVHWSRQFEYPWVIENGDFKKDQRVLDAGGGNDCCLLQFVCADMGCRVVNLDQDPKQFPTQRNRSILNVVGDIEELPFQEESFDRVICVSVIEHVKKPQVALQGLWNAVAPGGRLLVTLDVTSKKVKSDVADLQHGIGLEEMEWLVASLGLQVPTEPTDLIRHLLQDDTEIKVLCFYCDKPS